CWHLRPHPALIPPRSVSCLPRLSTSLSTRLSSATTLSPAPSISNAWPTTRFSESSLLQPHHHRN
ncbi:hypothetical protein GGI22_005558, partial [Coemansia erecta]